MITYYIKVLGASLNPFTPEFIKRNLPSPNLVTAIVANRGFDQNKKNGNSVDPDEMAHYEPSHLELHCL